MIKEGVFGMRSWDASVPVVWLMSIKAKTIS